MTKDQPDAVGRATLERWASQFEMRYGALRSRATLEAIRVKEQQVLGEPHDYRVRRAMGCLPFEQFATALVYCRSNENARRKLAEIESLCGPIARRTYTNVISRLMYYAAGVAFTLPERAADLRRAATDVVQSAPSQ